MGNDENSINIRISYNGIVKDIICNKDSTIKELLAYYIKEYLNSGYKLNKFTIKVNNIKCLLNSTIKTYMNDINNNAIFYLIYDDDDFDDIIQESCRLLEMRINIKFFKIGKNHFNINYNSDLHGLLKLCLLKEIAKSEEFRYSDFNNLPKILSNVMIILRNDQIVENKVEEGIKAVLKKINGSNIICFSKFVEQLISQNDINKYLIPYLNKTKGEIQYIRNCLEKYVEYSKRFEQEFERAKRNSVFEYSIISSAIIEREDIDKFEMNRQYCPNRIDRVLFHGTSYDAISNILPTIFRRSTQSAQHGKGVYFTEDLESCWIYGSEAKSNDQNDRRNKNIPQVGEYFSFIASAIYYNKNGFKRVYDYQYTPKKK